MPEVICAECGYEARDKFSMERHLNRKFPCNSIIIASKGKIKVEKIKDLDEEELMKEKEKKKLNYNMKASINSEKNKLEKE